ncbi:transposase [Roseiconus lacunae]|uniref:transposase n=1 Tax=Roseiconus lacunae TaxID=2605694 RepID=UPI00308F1B0B|nr:transposase [Stieleria sp. HD01]WRQ52763.1 transposase [Stieleria sp. HD01]
MNSKPTIRLKATNSATSPRQDPTHRSIVNVAFDVSSNSLDWAMELSSRMATGQCANSGSEIREALNAIAQQAADEGHQQVRVICESTGVYHRRLLQIAGQLGMLTNLVHGEAVAKCRAIQFADHGKTDRRDPKAALTVAKVGKLIKHRKLPGRYAQLRELHRLVLRCENRIRATKCELHADLRSLFPDLRLDKSVLYGPTGKTLINEFCADPYAIVAAGKEVFAVKMKQGSKYIKKATIEKIWAAASDVAEGDHDPNDIIIAGIRSTGVRQLYAAIYESKRNQDELEKQMQKLYTELQATDSRLPSPCKGVVTLRMLSRLVAEIGPPDDFTTINQLMRYAGLNLCERQSGNWKGRTMISRRGRSELRYVLNLMSIPLVSQGRLFSEYYHGKKDAGKMPGQKALTCVMRKILKMFFGWYKSGRPFDSDRVFAQANSPAAAS